MEGGQAAQDLVNSYGGGGGGGWAGGLSWSFWLVAVGVLWGCTNPLIKLGSRGLTELPKRSNPLSQFLAETLFLFTSWKYLVPFSLNLSGSVLFFWSLGSSEISLVVPITNSLTFLFTALTSLMLGETRSANKNTLLGMALVVLGVSICVTSKSAWQCL
jgi:drug/metabolite transporter (DMT)-like permease